MTAQFPPGKEPAGNTVGNNTRRPAARVRRFTDAMLRNLKPGPVRREVWGPNGLGVRIGVSGTRSWVFMYRHRGKLCRYTLGSYPDMSVAQAHEAHGRAIASLGRGVNPADKEAAQRRDERGNLTIEGLAAEYLEKHAKVKKRSWAQDERYLNKEILPVLGGRLAADVHRREVIELLDRIVKRGSPVSANRVLAVLARTYSWAVARELLETSPCLRIPKPAQEAARERFLSVAELRTFLLGLAKPDVPLSRTSRLALRLILATGQRPGEVAGAAWAEIDLKDGVWTIPPGRTKTGRAQTVPLSPYALGVLDAARALSPESAWVFPNPSGDGPMRALSLATGLRRALELEPPVLELAAFTPHDLRRSCATHLAAAGAPRTVVSALLNHADGSTDAIYDRHRYLPELRAALERWGEQLGELEKPETAKRTRKEASRARARS